MGRGSPAQLCYGILVRHCPGIEMSALTLFGLFAVTAMMVCYALEKRSTSFIFALALACVLGSIYGFLQGAWPFGIVEAIWAVIAVARWRHSRKLAHAIQRDRPVTANRRDLVR